MVILVEKYFLLKREVNIPMTKLIGKIKDSFTFKVTVIGLLAGVGLTGSSVEAAVITASQITLDEVITSSGNQWLIGDKLFSDFLYASAGGATPTNPVDITLTAINNGLEATGFTANAIFSSTSPLGDIVFGYTVEVTDPDKLIEDASLQINGISSGVVQIIEDLTSNGTFVDTLVVDNDNRSDTTTFSPVSELSVLKDIELIAEPPDNLDRFSFFAQTFSQVEGPSVPPVTPETVPEPASTVVFLALGFLGLSLNRENRQS